MIHTKIFDNTAPQSDWELCCFCRCRTPLWSLLPDRSDSEQVAVCSVCSLHAYPADVPSKRVWCRRERISTPRSGHPIGAPKADEVAAYPLCRDVPPVPVPPAKPLQDQAPGVMELPPGAVIEYSIPTLQHLNRALTRFTANKDAPRFVLHINDTAEGFVFRTFREFLVFHIAVRAAARSQVTSLLDHP